MDGYRRVFGFSRVEVGTTPLDLNVNHAPGVEIKGHAWVEEADGVRQPLQGVRVIRVDADPGEFPRIYQPGHPDADPDGFVRYPNVQMATEMVDLVAASRAYEANLNALRTFRDLTENTLSLLRSR